MRRNQPFSSGLCAKTSFKHLPLKINCVPQGTGRGVVQSLTVELPKYGLKGRKVK
jgi:hypothetical protein